MKLPTTRYTTAAIPQLIAIAFFGPLTENRFLNGPTSQAPASWMSRTIVFDALASSTRSRIAATITATTIHVSARTTRAIPSISDPAAAPARAAGAALRVGRVVAPRDWRNANAIVGRASRPCDRDR